MHPTHTMQNPSALFLHHRGVDPHSAPMSGQPKKKTLAQLRAEKEQSVQNLNLGREILQGVIAGFQRLN